MIIWTWLVGRVGQLAAGAIGVGLLMALLTGAGVFIVSWIRDGANADWERAINQATAKATAASEKAAQTERVKADADRAAALDRVRGLELELRALKDDPVCLPRAVARSLRK